jgi:hypothetical protein
MPKDGTTLRAQLADRTLNPSRNVAQGNTAATMIDVRLELTTGVTFNPEDIYDALVTKYGAGKVTTSLDTSSQGQYSFRIAP